MRLEYASVWTRFAALVIDGLLTVPFYIPIYIIAAASVREVQLEGEVSSFSDSSIGLMALSALAGFVFTVWNTMVRMGKTGQSLGRKFLRIAVLDEYGRPIGVGRAVLREVIGRWLSGIICYLGYLNAFWDQRRQMWHDKMANCLVYNVDENYTGGPIDFSGQTPPPAGGAAPPISANPFSPPPPS